MNDTAMLPSFSIRPMQPHEAGQVCDLVNRVFAEFVAPGYSQEGVQEFQKYVEPAALLQRLAGDHFVLVATVGEEVVGAIEMRHNEHVSLLFVDRQFLQRGIATALLGAAVDLCHEREPDLAQLTVNSSPYAVQIYEKLRFKASEPEQVKNGIRFVPMVCRLERRPW